MSGLALRGIDTYRRTEIESRTPLELVVMLYDGALRFLAEARGAMERKDVPTRRTALGRALAIVSELQSTLNMDAGGEISVELDRLYSFVTMRLTDASSTQDVRPLDDAVRVLSTLREGWIGISANGPVRPQLVRG